MRTLEENRQQAARFRRRLKRYQHKRRARGLYAKSAHREDWSSEELATLVAEHQQSTLDVLLQKLPGRSPLGVVSKAKKLGLKHGQPQGTLSVRRMAERAGFSPPAFRQILAWAEVPIKTFNYLTEKGVRRRKRQAVEIDLAIGAVALYQTTESVTQFHLRMGVRHELMQRWLRNDPLQPACVFGVRGKNVRYWTVDLLALLYRNRPSGGCSARGAAVALGVKLHSLFRAMKVTNRPRCCDQPKLDWWRETLMAARALGYCLPDKEARAKRAREAKGRTRERLRAEAKLCVQENASALPKSVV